MLLFLLFSVVSGNVIKNNIIPSELDDRCHAGLRLSKTKPDQFTPISCANIRYETTMKEVNFETKNIRDSRTDYPVKFDQGICKLKDIVYQPLDEDPFVAVVQNSYGYCSGDNGEKPHHDSARVSNVSCEQEGFRSIYTPNECGLHGDYGDTIPDNKTLFNKDIPWGCVKKDGVVYLNMYAKDDLPADAKNTSYAGRNTRLYNLTINSGIDDTVSVFLNEARTLNNEFDTLFALQEPPQGKQYLDEIASIQDKYDYLLDVTYREGLDRPARGIDWHLEYNKIFFSPTFYGYVRNITRREELMYKKHVKTFEMLKQQFKETKDYLIALDDFNVDLTNLHTHMNEIENVYRTAKHVNSWFKHNSNFELANMFVSIQNNYEEAVRKVADIKDKTSQAKDFIANALADTDLNALRTDMVTRRTDARDSLADAFTETNNERVRRTERWDLTQADKCIIFGHARCNSLYDGHVINELWEEDGRPDWSYNPDCITFQYGWQCGGDYDSDGESALQELRDLRVVLDPDYRVYYKYLTTSISNDATARILGTDVLAGTNTDELLDRAVAGLIVPSTVPIFSNHVQDQPYAFKKSESLDTCIHNGSPGTPVLGPDRFQNRLNIHQEIVNREHQMVEDNDSDNTQLLNLHQLKEEQPVLCGEGEYDCQCYETETNKEAALQTCTDSCDADFRHFWDQTEPRLTSKIFVHGRSECICMDNVLSERECVLANRQWVNELYVTQYKKEAQVADIPVRYDDLFLYCPVIECSDGLVKERCSYSGGMCEQGWFSGGVCYSEKPGCDGFTYEECMCGTDVCKPGKYCDGTCQNWVPDDKKLLHLAYINYD